MPISKEGLEREVEEAEVKRRDREEEFGRRVEKMIKSFLEEKKEMVSG